MRRIGTFLGAALLVALWCGFAAAQEGTGEAWITPNGTAVNGAAQAAAADKCNGNGAPAANAYGFTMDEIAVNQGVVAYWYAHGYANAFGCFPNTWAEVQSRGMPLRTFVSPHTGEVIDLDDGSLDFEGDMVYVPCACWDVQVRVLTSAGEVCLPAVLMGHPLPNSCCYTCNPCDPCNPCGSCNTCAPYNTCTTCNTCDPCGCDWCDPCDPCTPCNYDPCCAPCNTCASPCDPCMTCCAPCCPCPTCCDIRICDCECWCICSPQEAVCEITQWMMWRSFETFECLYDRRPCDDLEWVASGIAPIDRNYKEYAPFMDIEYIYKNKCCCCYLKKAYVHCCYPCMPCCQPCCDPCNPCDKCQPACNPCPQPCNPCKPVDKCNPCNPCPSC